MQCNGMGYAYANECSVTEWVMPGDECYVIERVTPGVINAV